MGVDLRSGEKSEEVVFPNFNFAKEAL